MPPEPTQKRCVAFVDGQNLFFAVKDAFGYAYPNYAFPALAAEICTARSWDLAQTRFYTGIPDAVDNVRWNRFWSAKLLQMSRDGVHTYSRPLRYRNKTFKLPDGSVHAILTGEEKGIDVRIAIDVIRSAHRNECDVALVFSQDQDLNELCAEVRTIAREQNRWIKIACAYPVSPTTRNRRGLAGSDWIQIDRATYDRCIDPRDHRPKP